MLVRTIMKGVKGLLFLAFVSFIRIYLSSRNVRDRDVRVPSSIEGSIEMMKPF